MVFPKILAVSVESEWVCIEAPDYSLGELSSNPLIRPDPDGQGKVLALPGVIEQSLVPNFYEVTGGGSKVGSVAHRGKANWALFATQFRQDALKNQKT